MPSRCFALAAAAIAMISGSDPILAATLAGDAVMVRHDVSGSLGGRSRAVEQGASVFQDETISTADASSARIVFLDRTDLAIGARASVKLDRFVYDPDAGARSLTVAAGRGVLRWISGRAPSSAYRVTTPHAVIGVRGTTFEVMVGQGRTIVALREGAVRVCPRGRGTCAELNRPGDVAVATGQGVAGPESMIARSIDLASACGSLGGGPICAPGFRRPARDAAPGPKVPGADPARGNGNGGGSGGGGGGGNRN